MVGELAGQHNLRVMFVFRSNVEVVSQLPRYSALFSNAARNSLSRLYESGVASHLVAFGALALNACPRAKHGLSRTMLNLSQRACHIHANVKE